MQQIILQRLQYIQGDEMTPLEAERQGYAIPMYDMVSNKRIWRIFGKEYITYNLFPSHLIKIGNRIVNCSKIEDVINCNISKS